MLNAVSNVSTTSRLQLLLLRMFLLITLLTLFSPCIFVKSQPGCGGTDPCDGKSTGSAIVPGSGCKQFFLCFNGQSAGPVKTCSGTTLFDAAGGFCQFEWALPSGCVEVACEDDVTITTDRPTVPPARAPSPGSAPTPGSAPSPGSAPTPGSAPFPESGLSSGSGLIPGSTLNDPDYCYNPCPEGASGFQTRPGTNCNYYVQCRNGEVLTEMKCAPLLAFNPRTSKCDSNYKCEPTPCANPDPPPITARPNSDTTIIGGEETASSPTTEFPERLSRSPTTPKPTKSPVAPTPTFSPSRAFDAFREQIADRTADIKSQVFVSRRRGGTTAPTISIEYTFEDMITALDIMTNEVPSDIEFYCGQGDGFGMRYGLVNLAAFLATAMVTGIRYDSCEEFNTDVVNGIYPISNACGQNSRSYQNETCLSSTPFNCPADNNMFITASTGPIFEEVNNPPPLQCHPKGDTSTTGYYDPVRDEVISSAITNSIGRSDVEGCCWWGRGVLWSAGTCTMGKLNFYLGRRAHHDGYYSRWPDMDFCTNPEAICESSSSRELRWVIGMLEWTTKVQSYDDRDTDWNYMDRLKRFVDGGMTDNTFMTQIGRILTGTPNIPFREERLRSFNKIIFEVFQVPPTPTSVELTQGSPQRTNSPAFSPIFPTPATPSKDSMVDPQPRVKYVVRTRSNGGSPSKNSRALGTVFLATSALFILCFL